MNLGYLWPIKYTKASEESRCETLRMELLFALYSHSKSILVYLSGISRSEIERAIVFLVTMIHV